MEWDETASPRECCLCQTSAPHFKLLFHFINQAERHYQKREGKSFSVNIHCVSYEWMENPLEVDRRLAIYFRQHLNWIKKTERSTFTFVERRLEINNYDKLWKINGKSSEKENGKSIDNWMLEKEMINPWNDEIIIED